MKNKEIIDLFQGLQSVGNLVGQKFVYCIARNINLLKPIVVSIESDRMSLIKSCSNLDEKGEPKVKDGKFDIKDEKSFNEEFKKFIDEEKEVKLFSVNYSDVPSNISANQLVGIFPIIKEDDTTKTSVPRTRGK